MSILKGSKYSQDLKVEVPMLQIHESYGSTEKSLSLKSQNPALVKGAQVSFGTRMLVGKIKDLKNQISHEPEESSDFSYAPTLQEKVPNVPPPPPLDFSLVDHELESYRTSGIAKIQAEFKQLRTAELASLESEKKRLLNEAYQEGRSKAQEEMDYFRQQKSQEYLEAINELSTVKAQLQEGNKKDLLHLSTKIAEQILNAELTQNPQIYINILDEALSHITDKDRVIMRVNPEDALLLRDKKELLSKHLSDIRHFIIQEDESISRGGCIIDTKLGYIDSSISSKLEMIENALLSVDR